MLGSFFGSMPQSDMVNSDASAATRALAQFPLTSSPMSVLAATRQGGTGKSTCAKICTWLMLFHFFSVACATSQHSSTLFDHSMSKWFDAVSSNFKMEANATDFDSIHHVAAAFYDMHHRTAHLSAVDDEFSDTFFHIATQPSHVPIFSASESIFNAHELSFVMHMVSADARHSGLRVNIDAQKLNVLTPPYVCGQTNMQGPNPENLGAHGDHLPHAAMQGGAVTRDDHRGGAPHHVSSFVRLVCALEGPVWCWAVQGGLGRMLCENDTFYRSIFSPGTSGFVNLARNTVHVDRVFRPSTTPDPVRDGRPWFECTSGDANNVPLDVSPYFLPYGDISIHGVAYASVNNSRAHTPPAQRLTPTVDVSVGCLAALDVEFHVALSGGTSRGRSSGFLLVHGGVHSDRCALSGPLVLQPV